MTFQEKFKLIFDSGHSISFQNQIRRKDGEYYSRIVWIHYLLPQNTIHKQCEWFGFETIEDCVNDCLKYLTTTA